MILIDKNRVAFEDLEIEELAQSLGLLRPIKNLTKNNAGAYKSVPIDTTCQKYHERLVDVEEYGIKSVPYYRYQATGNPTYGKNIEGAPDVNYVREGVVQKLCEMNEILAPLDIEIVVLDGHRSPTTQNILFSSFREKFYEQKGCALANITDDNKAIIMNKRKHFEEESKEFALQFCSSAENFDPKNPQTWTIHSTGGAVDIYLLDKRSNRVIDMGEGYFDNPADVTHMDYYENKENKTHQEQGYANARRLLFNTAQSVGAEFFAYECFHLDFDDQQWGLLNNKNASYGYVPSPKMEKVSEIVSSLQIFAAAKSSLNK